MSRPALALWSTILILAACSGPNRVSDGAERDVPPGRPGLDAAEFAQASPYLREVASEHPAGVWRFDEVPGPRDDIRAMRFEGNDGAHLGHRFPESPAASLSTWVRGASGVIASFRSVDEEEVLVVEAHATLRLVVSGEVVDSDAALSGQWQHLGVSYDGIGGRVVATLDGVLVVDREVAPTTLPAGWLVLGAGQGCPAACPVRPLTGDVADVAFYDRFLPSSRYLGQVLVADGLRPPVPSANELPLMAQTPPEARWTTMATSLDGRLLLTGSQNSGELILWDVEREKVIRGYDGLVDDVTALAIGPDGRMALAGDNRRGETLLYDLASGKILAEFGQLAGYPSAIAFAGDGQSAVAGMENGTLLALDLTTREEVARWSAPQGIIDVAVVGGGVALASWCHKYGDGCEEVRVATWMFREESEPVPIVDLPSHGHHDVRFVLAPEKQVVVSHCTQMAKGSCQESTVTVWELDKKAAGTEWTVPGRVDALALGGGPRGPWLVTNGSEVRVYDLDGAQLAGFDPRIEYKRAAVVGDRGVLLERWGDLDYWDIGDPGEPRPWHDRSASLNDVAISPDGRFVAAAQASDIIVWDLAQARLARVLRGHLEQAYTVRFSPDGRFLASGSRDRTVRLWDTKDWRLARTLTGARTGFIVTAFSPKGDRIAGSDGKAVRVWDVSSGEHVATIDASDRIQRVWWTERHLIAGNQKNGQLELWDGATFAPVRTLKAHRRTVDELAVSPDGTKAITSDGDHELRVWDLDSGKKVLEEELISAERLEPGMLPQDLEDAHILVKDVAFGPDGKRIASVGAEGWLHLWDASNGKTVRSWFSGAWIVAVQFAPDGRHLVTGDDQGRVRLWSISEDYGPLTLTRIGRGDDWLIATEDGYFDGSPGGVPSLTVSRGLDVFGPEQLAPTHNRPDEILRRFGLGSPAFIEHLEAVHRRRSGKIGLGADKSDEVPLELPWVRARVREVNGVPVLDALAGSSAGLARIQVFVDGVGEAKNGGFAAEGRRTRLEHLLELGPGRHRVSVVATDVAGVSSAPATSFVEGPTKTEPPRLFVVAFGVSDYGDPDIPDLGYAHQDVADLTSTLSALPGFAEVKVHAKVNREVTREAIVSAAQFLEGTRPTDTVVLFVAGHGLHDDAGTYYYLPHLASLDDLAGTAVDFATIEGLLDGIRARNKLFLLDTCESGEQSEERVHTVATTHRGTLARRSLRGVKSPSSNSVSVGPRTSPRFVTRKDRYVYLDLRRRTGSIVLSSSLGGEYSLEGPAFENGVFTEALLEALTSGRADTNADDRVDTDELRTYVGARVPELTDDYQHPTVDRDNVHKRIALPLPDHGGPYAFREHKTSVVGLVVTGDQQRVVSMDLRGTMFLWRASNRQVLTSWETKSRGSRLALSPGDRYIALGVDKEVHLYTLADSDKPAIVLPIGKRTAVVTFVGADTIAAAHRDGSITLWKQGQGKLTTLDPVEGKGTKGIGSLRVGDAGRSLLSSDGLGRVIKRSLPTGKVTATYAIHPLAIVSMDVSRDGRFGATGSFDGTATIFEVSTGKVLHRWPDHGSSLLGVALSADGKHVLTGGYDRLARVWSLPDGKLVETLVRHSNAVGPVAWAADMALTAHDDGTVVVWPPALWQRAGK